ncbi:uncharacterized protein EI90DRAFT_3062329 [Cantharellus anzutake]|uniref:uncharacterized protein n=1 Tax=Cantharellus anzutake TaxID=1750568 RepID=UPI00190775EE|nr:uncharacterized protein EI90DRAFT_3062329 [Cantharellus anzutake]KAF8329351.1 hypothetical protein EI90DRAFT_3062329 [Cantharellus anzutake]
MPKTVRDPPPHLQSLPPASTQNQSSSRAFATPTPSSPKAPPSSTELSNDADNNGAAMDVLIQNVSALTLVPSSIRFGRGGKQRGSAPRPRRNNQLSAGLTSNMELDLKSG